MVRFTGLTYMMYLRAFNALYWQFSNLCTARNKLTDLKVPAHRRRCLLHFCILYCYSAPFFPFASAIVIGLSTASLLWVPLDCLLPHR